MPAMKIGLYWDAHLTTARATRATFSWRLAELRAAGVDFLCTPINLTGDAAYLAVVNSYGLKIKLETNGFSVNQALLEANPIFDSYLTRDDAHALAVGTEMSTIAPIAATVGTFPTHFTLARQDDITQLDRFIGVPGAYAIQCYAYKTKTIYDWVYKSVSRVKSMAAPGQKVIAILQASATGDPWDESQAWRLPGRISSYPCFPTLDYFRAQLWAAHAAGADEAWFYSLCEFGSTAGETLAADPSNPKPRRYYHKFFAYHDENVFHLRKAIRDYKALAQYPVAIDFLDVSGDYSLTRLDARQREAPYAAVRVDARLDPWVTVTESLQDGIGGGYAQPLTY